MPWCDTDAMAAHLIEISAAVDPGAHAVLIVDQAGWHLTPKLAILDNITVLALPPRSPELNPGGECLAIHARQLVVEPDLQILRRHRRAVLPSLEQPHRPTMEDHVPRHAQMGAWVLINDRWYNVAWAQRRQLVDNDHQRSSFARQSLSMRRGPGQMKSPNWPA